MTALSPLAARSAPAGIGRLREIALSAEAAASLLRAARLVRAATGARAAAVLLWRDTDLVCVARLGLADDDAALALCEAGQDAPAETVLKAPLAGAEGAALGVLCVAGEGLAADAAALLGDVAQALIDEFALRAASPGAETMLRDALLVAATADGVMAALEQVMAAMCRHTGAALCHVWRREPGTSRFRMLGGVTSGRLAGSDFVATWRDAEIDLEGTRLGAALLAGRQVVTPSIRGEDRAQADLQRISLRYGLASRVTTPLHAGADDYALALCFDRPDVALQAVAGLVSGLALPLAAVLRRLQEWQRANLFQRVVEATGDGVLVTEASPIQPPGPRILYANPAFARLTGYAPAEVIGRSPHFLHGPQTEPEARTALRTALSAGLPVRQEITNYRKDGGRMVLDLQISPLADAGGRVTHFVSVQRDITAAMQAAAETARREAAFHQLFHRNPVPMWVYDSATLRFLEVNEAATRVYGWSRAAFLAKTILDIRPAEEHARVLESVAGRREQARAVSGPWRHLTAGGALLLVQTASSPMLFDESPAVLVAVFDITETLRTQDALRRSEAALARSAAELREAMRVARLGTWQRRAGREVDEWSDEIFAMFGRSRADFVPTRDAWMACVHEDDQAAVAALAARVRADGAPRSCTFRVVHPDGRLVHCWTEMRLLHDAETGEDFLAGVCQDVTERHQTEQRLLQAEKLSTIGQMTGGIAHDFNNLLTVISISLELAEEMAQDQPGMLPLLRAAGEAAHKGAELTAQLLSYARRQPLRPSAVSPGDFAADLLELLPRVLGERYRIEAEVAPVMRAFLADPAQLETAMLNLFLNARDAMPQGGTIRLALAMRRVAEGEVDDLPGGEYVAIAVRDQGTGMSAATLARVFDPFFTTKPVGKGTGLGLSMVLGFAKQSGGHVSVDSAPGEGAEVRLLLPTAGDAPPVPAPVAAPARSLPPLEVLVVEDKADVRAIACRMCGELGLMPTGAASAEEALHYLRAGFRFGLLFTDVVLAGPMDGVELAGQARALVPGLPVLFTSGYSETGPLRRERMRASDRLLNKPYSRAQFVAAVDAVLQAAEAERPA